MNSGIHHMIFWLLTPRWGLLVGLVKRASFLRPRGPTMQWNLQGRATPSPSIKLLSVLTVRQYRGKALLASCQVLLTARPSFLRVHNFADPNICTTVSKSSNYKNSSEENIKFCYRSYLVLNIFERDINSYLNMVCSPLQPFQSS